MDWNDHNLPQGDGDGLVTYETKPIVDKAGQEIEGLHSVWITLDNPSQLNSYTTGMVKDLILAFRRASNDRAAVAAVFTGSGTRAFCTGGNTKEYAEYYAGQPAEYMQYMRLFNDMVSNILMCDLPVICRVNGMRVAGGQEIGMACDFTVSSDLANFGQAGPRHGSAAIGGSTDFLASYVGIENAMYSCTMCEMWSAHKSKRLGLITECVPALQVEGAFVPNPMVTTDRYLDEMGNVVHGEFKTGAERDAGKAILKSGDIDLSLLDKAVNRMITNLIYTFPGCITQSLMQVRKTKLHQWDANKESNRAWLGLNMMTEARAGFRAFNEGVGRNREVDFIDMRRRLAEGERWDEAFIDSILPRNRKDRSV